MHSAIPIFQCFNVMKTVPFVFVLIYRYKTIAWQDRLRTNVCTGKKVDGKERGGVGFAHRCKCPRVSSHRACKRFRCSSSPETEKRSPLASTLSRRACLGKCIAFLRFRKTVACFEGDERFLSPCQRKAFFFSLCRIIPGGWETGCLRCRQSHSLCGPSPPSCRHHPSGCSSPAHSRRTHSRCR